MKLLLLGNVTSASFNTLPDVPDAVANDTAVLAYEPPDTSVPLPASVGSEVHSDTYMLAGAVYVVAFRVAFKSAFSKKLLISAMIFPLSWCYA
jgi:hypothetical protein